MDNGRLARGLDAEHKLATIELRTSAAFERCSGLCNGFGGIIELELHAITASVTEDARQIFL